MPHFFPEAADSDPFFLQLISEVITDEMSWFSPVAELELARR